MEKAVGADQLDLASSLDGLAVVYDTEGKHAEADPLFKRSLAIKEKALGPNHPRLANFLQNYAAHLRATKHASEADQMEAREKAIRAANH